ncbi:RIP metalloprotease RseP [Piscinibacter sakaiensis]|uniref:RIP metalloprotease RseP n=1 Tax=Piscinibacter sakaiensis TaxID=1547922 RepID=UPI003AAFB663
MIFTILAFIVTLGVLIVIHEYGHYRVARACGVKVLRFSVGFGRVLWRRQATPDSTEFVVSALPLGGYVRMLDEREGEVPAHQLSMAFNRKPLAQRAAVVAAGPLANLLLAVLLYATANWIGIEEPKALLAAPPAESVAARAGVRAGDWARAVSVDGNQWVDLQSMTDLRWEVTQAAMRGEPLLLSLSNTNGTGSRTVTLDLAGLEAREVDASLMQRIGLGRAYSEPVLGEIRPGGPAARAGLQSGDLVLSVDGVAVADAASLRETIRASVTTDNGGKATAKPMQWRVERQGRTLSLQVEPIIVSDKSGTFARVEAFIGRPAEMVTVSYGVFDGLAQAAVRTWDMSILTLKMMGRMVTGDASLKNLSGPLTIADYAGQSARLGLAYYLGFLAIVSVSLGVLNLLPLPMLDGGHLIYYLFEAVTGRPVSELWLDRLQRGGVAILLMVMSLALYNDVARLLGLH